MSERPPSPWPETEGFESVAEVDTGWRPGAGKGCRYTTGPGRRTCRKPSVAEFRRGSLRVSWWAYCPEHLWGRWIEDGQVMHWILKPVEAPHA